MSYQKNDIINMKIRTSSDMLKTSDVEKNVLSSTPLQNINSAASKAVQPPWYFLPSNTVQPGSSVLKTNYIHPSCSPQTLSLNTNPTASMNCKTGDKPKSTPQSQKRVKTKTLVQSGVEEQNNNDLADVVKMLTPDKSIDSDSSTSTIFMDDDNGRIFNKEYGLTSRSNDTPLSIPQNTGQHSFVNNFPNQKNSLITTLPYSNSSCFLPQYPSSSSPLLKTAPKKNSPKLQTVASVTFSILTNMNSAASNKATSVTVQPKKRVRKNQPKAIMYNQNSVTNNINFPISDGSQINKRMSMKSVYESMGLDEDLCDENVPAVGGGVFPDTTSPKSDNSSVKANEYNKSPVNDFLNVPIKIERNPTPPPNDMHVDMTFEEDTSYNDDLEDDLPLSFLKDRLLVDDIAPQSELPTKPNTLNNENEDIPLALFIKKELIEDEIVSESPEVSTKNLSSVDSCVTEDSGLSCSSKLEKVKDLSAGIHYDPAVVNIKTEPDSDHESSVTTESTSSLFLHEPPPVPVPAADETSAKNVKIPKKRKQKSAPKVSRKKKNLNNFAMQDETSIETNTLEIEDGLNLSRIPLSVSDSSRKSTIDSIDDTINAVIKNSILESNDISSEKDLMKADADLLGASVNDEQSTSKSLKKVKASINKSGKKNAKKGGKSSMKLDSILNLNASIEIKNNVHENFQNAASKQFTENSEPTLPVSSESSLSNNFTTPDLELGNKKSAIKRKAKKKKNKKSVNVDENLPITLLIKRNKSNPDDDSTPESFLYTSINKSLNSESNFSSNQSNSSGNHSSENEVEKLVKSVDNDSCVDTSAFEQSPPSRKQKNKKKSVKKNRKKGNFTNIVTETVDSNMPSNNNVISNSPSAVASAIPVLNVESDKTAESSFDSHVAIENNSCNKVQNSSGRSVATDSNTSVYMPFEASPSNQEASDSISDVGKENAHSRVEADKQSDSLANTVQNSLLQLSQNADISEADSEVSTSNSNISDVNSRLSTNSLNQPVTPNKKKKKKPRYYGWYKKKKSKVTKKNSSASLTVPDAAEEPTVSTSPVSVANQDIALTATVKMPVVVIKNLGPNIKTNSFVEAESIQNNSVASCQELANLFVENKKRKKSSNNTNKKSCREMDSSENMPINDTEIECNENSDQQGSLDMHSKNKSREDSSFENFLSMSAFPPQKLTRSLSEETVIADFLSENGTETTRDAGNIKEQFHTPSLDVAEYAEEIAKFESIFKQNSMENAVKGCEGNSDLNKLNAHSKNKSSDSLSTSMALSAHSEHASCLPTDFHSSGVNIKKEKDDNYSKNSETSLNQVSLIFGSNSNKTTLPAFDKTQPLLQNSDKDSLLVSLASIKKEPCVGNSSEDQFLKKLFIADNVPESHPVFDDLSANRLTAKNGPNNFRSNILNSGSQNISELSTNSNTNCQSESIDFCDKLALNIKKEICEDVRSSSSKYVSVNEIKNQNELIEKANIHNVCTTAQSVSSSPVDDEIQVLGADKQKSKTVPCIDLTEDNLEAKHQEMLLADSTNAQSTVKNSSLMSSSNTVSNDNLTTALNENRQSAVTANQNLNTLSKYDSHSQNLVSKSDDSHSQINVSQSKVSELAPDFTEEEISASDDEIVFPAIVKDKYKTEYLKHPYPPSVVSYQSEKRNMNKMYSRINCKAWNLSLSEVESRLKYSEYTTPQFGKKLGDIVKLEKYPVSSSEAECYHRILGVAPSHKLLSKCFKSPDSKMSTVVSSEFSAFPGFHQVVDSNKFEDKLRNPMPCNDLTLNDIMQGISESKMMCNSNFKINSELVERDCPSADTRDSCDSHFSNFSDKFVSKKEFKNQLKDSEYVDFCKETGSSCRNSVLSSEISISQDSQKGNVASLKQSAEEYHKSNVDSYTNLNVSSTQNTLDYLTLPNKEVLDTLLSKSETKSLAHGEVQSSDNVSFATSVTTSTLKCDSPYSNKPRILDSRDHLQSTPPSSDIRIEPCKFEDRNSSLSLSSTSVNLIDVAELRKILQTAESLCPEVSSVEIPMWKSKATFEYNHTQKVPVVETRTQHNLFQSPSSVKSNAVSDASRRVNEENSGEMLNQANSENSDDDFVDNEPISNEVDDERDEDSGMKEDIDKDPVKIPQYKSKWEKIMERKLLENKEKEKKKINEQLLKDCFPVSASKTLSKKSNNTEKPKKNKETEKSKKSKETEKATVKPSEKAPEKLKERINKKIEQSKSIKSKDAKNESPKILSPRKSKGKDLEPSLNLFVPDKPVKASEINKMSEKSKKSENKEKSNKKEDTKKLDDNVPSKRFYGNRVTNRGTFLTESSTAEFLKKIKIPKKKPPEVPKKSMNVRSEEFHSMVKSPDIDIAPTVISSYNKRNKSNFNSHKNTEFYKRNSSYKTFSSSSHLPESQYRQRDKYSFSGKGPDMYYTSEEKGMQNRRPSFLDTQSMPHHMNNENVLSKRAPHLGHTSFHHQNDSSMQNRKVPPLNVPSSISPQLPATNSFQLNTNSQKTLVESILSVLQNPAVPEVKDRILPFSELLNPMGNTSQHASLNRGYDQQPLQNTLNSHPNVLNESLSVLPSTYRKDLPSSVPFNVLNSIPGLSPSSFPNQKQIEPSSDPSQILNSSPVVIPASSNPVTPQPTRKTSSTCLVPPHLKSMVGHKTIETQDVRLLMLEWSVDWLVQQQKFHDPPPISKALKKVVSSYDNFEDYYNTYFPLMLLDTWQRIYVSWTHLSQVDPYYCEITSYSVKSNYVSVECQTVFNTTNHPKGVFPDEGSILMVKYGTKSNEFAIKILGYVTSVKTRRFNHVTDSKMCGYKSPKEGNYINVDVLQVLTLTYMGVFNSEEIDKRLPVRIHVLCNVKATLKQNDALLYITKSPLHESILNPVEHGLISVALTPRNSVAEKVNECIRDITKGILSPHPLPLLTIVRAMPESDRLTIIPSLIDKMKNSYKTKVLLCVRTVRALGDIAANICLHDSLKLVIINKRCDTNLQFQKFLLDELVSQEVSRSSAVGPQAKNEAVMKARKQIFNECDVVLSLIRNCHDEFMEETFTETEAVAQMCCIIDEANLCTEPETLIPILHGISKLILIGDPDCPAKVLSKTASSYDYNRSFFQRAYDLDSITE